MRSRRVAGVGHARTDRHEASCRRARDPALDLLRSGGRLRRLRIPAARKPSCRTTAHRTGQRHPQHPLHQRHHRPTEGRVDQPAGGGNARPAAGAMVRTHRARRLHRMAPALSLRRRRVALRDGLDGRQLRDLQAGGRRADVRADRARPPDLDAAAAGRDHRLSRSPRTRRTRPVDAALRHRLREHDAAGGCAADRGLRHRFLRCLRPERDQLPACAQAIEHRHCASCPPR